MPALLFLLLAGSGAVSRASPTDLVAAAEARPWLHEEENVVRHAARPDLCVTAADGDALELRPCGGEASARQRLFAAAGALGRGALALAGGCAAADASSGAVSLAPCVDGKEQSFVFPSSGRGSIKLSRAGSSNGGQELCLTPSGPAVDGTPMQLQPCDTLVESDDQAFLLPRVLASSSGHNGAFLGVNLGGWLILESWMWPGEMLHQHIHDEYSFVAKHGGPSDPRAREKMQGHWDTFLRPEHLDSLRRFGITHVRIPVGYWIFDAVYREEDGFVAGGEPYLARALGWLKARGMKAVIDLHALPGGQARRQSFTGRVVDSEGFFNNDTHFARGKLAVRELVELVQKYEADPSTSGVVVGVELLNEPSHRHIGRIKEFYSEMVPVVRKSLPADRYLIMLSFMDSPHSKSMNWLAEKIAADPGNWSGVVHDPHLYHLFGDNSRPWSQEQDYCKVCCRDKHILLPATAAGVPVVVGEYSIATGYTGWHEGGFPQKNLHNYLSLHSTASNVVGSFLWNFRIIVDPAHPMRYLEWSLVDMIDQGYLAPDLAYRADLSSLCPAMENGEDRCPDYSGRTVWWNTPCEWQAAPPPPPQQADGGIRRRLAPAAAGAGAASATGIILL